MGNKRNTSNSCLCLPLLIIKWVIQVMLALGATEGRPVALTCGMKEAGVNLTCGSGFGRDGEDGRAA